MKNWRQMLAFMLAAVLTFGTLEISAIASEDAGAVVEAFAPSEEGTEMTNLPTKRFRKAGLPEKPQPVSQFCLTQTVDISLMHGMMS